MDMFDNPNYYTVNRPYKLKYICCNCRKVFKRKVVSEIKSATDTIELHAKCPDCGQMTTYIGPKFRAPKSDNIKAWHSIKVLSDIGTLHFMGFANENVIIPESKKGLTDLLTKMKTDCEISIRRYLSFDYNETNKEQIKMFSDIIKRIDNSLKQ